MAVMEMHLVQQLRVGVDPLRVGGVCRHGGVRGGKVWFTAEVDVTELVKKSRAREVEVVGSCGKAQPMGA